MERFDYVIVGGGSAGCIVAAELSEDPSVRVLLLEHGDDATEHPETGRADGYKDAFINEALMHERFSAVDARWGSRRLFMGSGRGLGGSGNINGMVYTRGSELDYAEWPEGWRWSDVVPGFEALEAKLRPNPRPPTRFTEVAIAAAEEAGFRREDDLNAGDLSGVLGYEHMNYEGADRRSSYYAFLAPAMGRPNLEVRTRARVERLVVEGRRVVGARYERDGAFEEVRATREVVMCAGALVTPAILMRSGIGPATALRRVGLPSLIDAPGVGQNLHDHPNVSVFFRGREPLDVNYPQLYGFHRANEASDLPPGQSDTCYVFYPARSSLEQMMVKLVPAIVLPQTLYDVPALPAALRGGVRAAFGQRWFREQVERVYGIVVILGKPKSRGVVTLTAADPRVPARIDPGYFADPEDMETMLLGVERAQRIAGTSALSAWGNGEISPGPIGRSRAALETWVRLNVMTTYHYAGTCAMGEAPGAVTDPRLRLRGAQGLRIADASAIPTTPVSALNAPSMLVGLRAAAFCAEERRGGAMEAA